MNQCCEETKIPVWEPVNMWGRVVKLIPSAKQDTDIVDYQGYTVPGNIAEYMSEYYPDKSVEEIWKQGLLPGFLQFTLLLEHYPQDKVFQCVWNFIRAYLLQTNWSGCNQTFLAIVKADSLASYLQGESDSLVSHPFTVPIPITANFINSEYEEGLENLYREYDGNILFVFKGIGLELKRLTRDYRWRHEIAIRSHRLVSGLIYVTESRIISGVESAGNEYLKMFRSYLGRLFELPFRRIPEKEPVHDAKIG